MSSLTEDANEPFAPPLRFTFMFRLLFYSWLLTLPFQQPETALRQAQTLFEQRQFAEAAKLACTNPNHLPAVKLCGLALQLSQQIPQAEQIKIMLYVKIRRSVFRIIINRVSLVGNKTGTGIR